MSAWERLRALYAKEARAFFDAPTAYVVTVILLLICGYLFATPLFVQGQASLAAFVELGPLLLLFFVPAVTMRLYSEEIKSGTIEILATLPVGTWEILLSKYLAALAMTAFMLAGTLAYPAALWLLGEPDWGAMAGAYAGLWLVSALFAAVGLWASSMTRNQVVAFILAFLGCFALYLAGKLHLFMPAGLAPLSDFIGVDAHLETMSRGVLDLRDLLYFASMSALPLFLAGLRLGEGAAPRRPARAAAAGALFAGCLVLVNLLASRLSLRADLSRGGLYSLGAGSKRVLASLPGPVEVRGYFSKELPPEFAAARSYADDMLREYRAASRGRLRFRVRTLDTDPDSRQEALRQGIAPLQFNVVSRDKYEVREGFMGLVLQYGDKKEVLPVLSRPESLEYDLTSRLRQLTRASKARIGLLASHGAVGPDGLHPQVREYLARAYELDGVRLDGPGAAVPEALAGLLVLGPTEKLGPEAVAALDRFLLGGRPLVLAVDGRSADTRSFFASDLDTGLGPLLAHYGARLLPNFVLDAKCQQVAVSSQRGWYALQNVLEFPPFVIATDLDREHPLTRSLSSLSFPFACPLELKPGARALARSSRASWQRQAWAKGSISVSPMSDMRPLPADPKGPFALAAALEGPFTGFVSSGTHSPASARMIVVGTSRFARPDMAAGESGALFLLNLVDWVGAEPDLIAIRSKAAVFRPLAEISPAAKAAVRWALLLLPPLAVAGAGTFRLAARRRARARRLALYAPAAAPPPPKPEPAPNA